MSPPPRVIVCLAAYNSTAFITQVLASFLAQDYPNFAVWVGDDGSTDGTPETVEALAAQDPRIRLIRNPERLGWTRNCNALLEAASSHAELACFHPHDDLVAPSYLSQLVAALQTNPAAVMAYSDLLMTSPWNPDGEVVAFSAVENLATPLQRGQAIIRQGVKVKTWWVAHRGLFRISTARETGALRRHPFGEAAADWGWVLALALRGELIRVPATLYTKNFHSGGLSAKWLGRSWRSRSSQWAGGLWMCATTIIRAPLRIPDKLRLGFTTAGLGARWFGWLGKRALRISAE